MTVNGLIMVWPRPYHHITALCCLLLATWMSELDKIHPLIRPSGPSNVTRGSSIKIKLDKTIFHAFFAQFCYFEIFALVRRGCQGEIWQIPIHKIVYTLLFHLNPLISANSNWWKVIVLLYFTFISRKTILKTFSLASNSQLSFNNLLYSSMISPKHLWLLSKWKFPHLITI